MTPPAHAPTRWLRYVEAHDNHMGQLYREEFVQGDTLMWSPVYQGFQLTGEIACRGNIVIRVDKTLAILDPGESNPRVQTEYYAYNASVKGHGTIRRYDNEHAHPGHPDAHHRHDGDWRTGQEATPVHVGEQGWPTLSEFIREIAQWYDEHRDELPDPDGVPEIR